MKSCPRGHAPCGLRSSARIPRAGDHQTHSPRPKFDMTRAARFQDVRSDHDVSAADHAFRKTQATESHQHEWRKIDHDRATPAPPHSGQEIRTRTTIGHFEEVGTFSSCGKCRVQFPKAKRMAWPITSRPRCKTVCRHDSSLGENFSFSSSFAG